MQLKLKGSVFLTESSLVKFVGLVLLTVGTGLFVALVALTARSNEFRGTAGDLLGFIVLFGPGVFMGLGVALTFWSVADLTRSLIGIGTIIVGGSALFAHFFEDCPDSDYFFFFIVNGPPLLSAGTALLITPGDPDKNFSPRRQYAVRIIGSLLLLIPSYALGIFMFVILVGSLMVCTELGWTPSLG